jgi:hypothetical protein
MLKIVGRMVWLGPTIFALAVVVVLFAQTQSAVAGKPASKAALVSRSVEKSCTRTTEKAMRSLSSAKASRLRTFCTSAQRHANTVRFWMNPEHRWTLYLQHPHQACWELSADELEGPRSLCILARAEVRIHKAALVRLNRKLKALLPKPRPRLVKDGLFSAFVCIHGYEGAWNADTGNGYYGGLQMDLTFQRQYGPDFRARWGTADKWPPWAQMTAAIRAYHGWPQAPDPKARTPRGFHPWPHTAVACRLL